jgi:hypothetical protein
MSASARPVRAALERIEDSVLPALSAALDGLIDAAALARPGADADQHATELRFAAQKLAALGDLLESFSAYAAPAEVPARISA